MRSPFPFPDSGYPLLAERDSEASSSRRCESLLVLGRAVVLDNGQQVEDAKVEAEASGG